MTVKEAAVQVLNLAGKPLHVKVIAEQMISTGLFLSTAKRPDNVVSAQLLDDIKKNGDSSPFVKVAPRTYRLREHAGSDGAGQEPKAAEASPLPAQAPTNGGLSYTESARKVLEQYGNHKPMHYRKITQTAIEQRWLAPSTHTPEATMYAQIFAEIKRQQQRGERPRFEKHGEGYFGLTRSAQDGLDSQIKKHNAEVRKTLLGILLAMTPAAFEEFVSRFLAEMGFVPLEVTKLSGDGGVDVRGTFEMSDVMSIMMAIQVKKWKPGNNVQAPIVQQLRGSLSAHEHGLIITTSDFSKGAVKEAVQAAKSPIALMNGERLVQRLIQMDIAKELGVEHSNHHLYDIKSHPIAGDAHD